ncbi:MAG: hypothetical protein EAZ85_14185 [Bacteroidetes bacterium]|nr:MAG: hypothetical protein EAZ85_14185 [Bacteroidota bacterium]TAG93289.1 MAG: hypothetical protein EAZ20_01770 [Bacteroidota bacterium]
MSIKQKNMKKIIFLSLIFATFLLVGCYTKPEFSTTPNISFVGIDKFTVTNPLTTSREDSIIIKIKFQDGDGDLGLDQGDTLGTFKRGQPNHFNYKISVFVKNGAIFNPLPLPDPSFTYDGRFPRLEDRGRKNPLEGILTRNISFKQSSFVANTILKFRIKIYDRALNVSNEIETSEVVVRQL